MGSTEKEEKMDIKFFCKLNLLLVQFSNSTLATKVAKLTLAADAAYRTRQFDDAKLCMEGLAQVGGDLPEQEKKLVSECLSLAARFG